MDGKMYSGDLKPKEAYERLKANPEAVLIDVRTAPEWAYVGVPVVERLLRVSWQNYPSMTVNPDFVATVGKTIMSKDTEILCICRSGARSAAAASALTAAGYRKCWNVAEGFEGDRDADGHRGATGGWKAAGLPWVQS
jgi:rhodanese-related sulfurtransferase